MLCSTRPKMSDHAELEWTDYLTLAIYLVIVLIVGLWATLRPDRGTTRDYFLASRHMTWFPIGASLYASNIGAHMFVGIPASGAESGMAILIYEWHAVYLLILMAWVCVPVYISSGSYTVAQYARRRYDSKRLQVAIACISFVIYMANKVSTQVYAGTVFLRYTLGWNIYISTVAILAVTTINTIAVGLPAVMYTDTLQTGVFLAGATTLLVKGLSKVGGWENMQRRYLQAAANYTLSDQTRFACGMPRQDAFHLLQDPRSDDTPWTGAVSGLTFMGMYYWCFDQVEVQRCLAAKSLTHAKAGAVFAGFLKLVGAFLFVIPGMIARALFPDNVACAEPSKCQEFCDNPTGCWNMAYPLLMSQVLPAGLQGLMLAAILSALMSTLTSVFNSTSALFSVDVWLVLRPNAHEREIMVVSRACIFVLMTLSISWLPVHQQSPGGQLWDIVQSVSAYCCTPASVVMMMSILSKRTTEAGAFWGLLSGMLIGFSRFVLDRMYPVPPCGNPGPDPRPALISKVHFLHFAAIIAVVTFLITVVISAFTTPQPDEKLYRVTWWTRKVKTSPYWMAQKKAAETSSERPKNDKPRRCHLCREFFCRWIFGIGTDDRSQAHELETGNIKNTSIKEDAFWTRAVDIAAIVFASITAFAFGFFA